MGRALILYIPITAPRPRCYLNQAFPEVAVIWMPKNVHARSIKPPEMACESFLIHVILKSWISNSPTHL